MSAGAATDPAATSPLVGLDEDVAADPALTGGKAAALARAARGSLATLPGVVLTTAFSDEVDGGAPVEGHRAVAAALERVGPHRALVVRSSSVVEDQADTSAAGQFESVVGVRGLAELERAVTVVLGSRARAGAADQPIAVLVQPLLEPEWGGVLFGVDPVTGRGDGRVVTAVAGGPDALVSGEVDGTRYLLDAGGGVLEADERAGVRLPAAVLDRLVRLATEVERTFGSPQDVEWAWADGEVVLLQSRPVTTPVVGTPFGPVYGPGPVAETFPEPLSTLEQDLWVPPLAEAVRSAVVIAGAAPRREVEQAEAVVVVGGRVALDLELGGGAAEGGSGRRRWSPAAALRRLRTAWRVGRLGSALPGLCEDLLDRCDEDLGAVPPLHELTDRQLVGLLGRGREVLRSLHGHEMLVGLLTDAAENRLTGASVALRILDEARREGRGDAEIVERSPVVLALTGPRVGPGAELPAGSTGFQPPPSVSPSTEAGVLREALRLRVRWVQELTGRAAWSLGVRLAGAGVLDAPAEVRRFSLEALAGLVTGRAVPARVTAPPAEEGSGGGLPARFRLDEHRRPVPLATAGGGGGGTGPVGVAGRGPSPSTPTTHRRARCW